MVVVAEVGVEAVPVAAAAAAAATFVCSCSSRFLFSDRYFFLNDSMTDLD